MTIQQLDEHGNNLWYGAMMVYQGLHDGSDLAAMRERLASSPLRTLTDEEILHVAGVGQRIFNLKHDIPTVPTMAVLLDALGEGILALLVHYLQLEQSAAMAFDESFPAELLTVLSGELSTRLQDPILRNVREEELYDLQKYIDKLLAG